METTLTKPVYKVDSAKKEQFVGILLLNYIINEGGILPILMDGDFRVLDPLAVKMVAKGYFQVSGSKYIPTKKGEDVLKTFMNRYLEYLKIYDIFCAVDTKAGEFAFEKFYDLDDDAWKLYLNESRFEDVRIAVAEFKKLDPLEIVFMSFINEERFDFSANGWQFEIYTGLVWSEIEKICNTAISVSELNGEYPEVTENVVKRGAEVAINLMKIEDERKAEDEERARLEKEDQDQEIVEEMTEETTVTEYSPDYYYQPCVYYEPYYDPFYISPIWIVPLLLL